MFIYKYAIIDKYGFTRSVFYLPIYKLKLKCMYFMIEEYFYYLKW